MNRFKAINYTIKHKIAFIKLEKKLLETHYHYRLKEITGECTKWIWTDSMFADFVPPEGALGNVNR